MDLSTDQHAFYEEAREHCRQDVEQANITILSEWQNLNSEIQRVQDLIQVLEGRKQHLGQMYASCSDMLGLEYDLDISPAISEG